MARDPLLVRTDRGLYCPPGDFYVDPWRPVPRAVVTHAHADHLRWGCDRYLVTDAGRTVTRARLGPDAIIDTLPYGETVSPNGVTVSFHPAGHILGSGQVRVEHRGEVWVVSGDYKTGDGDPTCEPFEPVRCHTFITESTFGLPIYRWPSAADLAADLNAWWRANREAGKASLVFGYALGKAQRILAAADPTVGPIYTHGAVERLTAAYREAGVSLPPTQYAGVMKADGTGAKRRVKRDWAGALVVAPPSAHGSAWARKFAPASTAFCSGWMAIRGTRRRKAVDRGLVMSDHADWPGLLSAIAATGAERVYATHGYTAVLVRWLREKGVEADAIATHFEGESGGDEPGLPADPTDPPAVETER
jgi:putative mRNA 3-end processing factor